MNWHRNHQKERTPGDRVADLISEFIGSWKCVWLHTVWFLLWFDLNLDINSLTLIVSLEAIFLCIFLLMSGNRQSERDRHQAEADYTTNVLAKREIERLQIDIGRIEAEKLDTMVHSLNILVSSLNEVIAPKQSTRTRRKLKVSRK